MPRKFNDITLIVSGKKFMANKAILSEKSDYFKAMFSSGMLESNSNEVVINGISRKGFRDILRYMHGLVVEVDPENILNLLVVADYIQANEAIEICEKFLIFNLNAQNWPNFTAIAERYSLVDLKEHAFNFIAVKFLDIAKTETFHLLTPEHIYHTVTADKEVKFSELDLLEGILQWGLKPSDLTIEEKLKHVEDILGHVRFFEIPKKELNEMLEKISAKNSAIHAIHKKIVQLSVLPCNSLRRKFSTRGLKKAILKIGGFGVLGKKDSIKFNFINDTKWVKLTQIPYLEESHSYYRSAVINNELYMIGNFFVQCDEIATYSIIMKFSYKTNNWEMICTLDAERWRFSISEVDDKIYVVGGSFKVNRISPDGFDYQETNTVERYDPITETWEFIGSLPQPRESHASVNFANTLYISGGITNSQVETSVMKYHPLSNTWLSCAPLLSPRAEHSMITYGDKIYVCGGWIENPDSPGLVELVDTIDEYDVANDSWRIVTKAPGRIPFARAIFVESKIYFLEDYHDTKISDNELYEIDCYDVITNEWSKELKERKNSTGNWDYDCVTMYLPKSLADDHM